MTEKAKRSPEEVVREIKRKTRSKFTSEEKIRIVLEGLRGEESISTICRREGINPNLYYRWSKSFLEAGKKRLSGDGLVKALLKLDKAINENAISTTLKNLGQSGARKLQMLLLSKNSQWVHESGLDSITLDADSTVKSVYGNQEGAEKGLKMLQYVSLVSRQNPGNIQER